MEKDKKVDPFFNDGMMYVCGCKACFWNVGFAFGFSHYSFKVRF